MVDASDAFTLELTLHATRGMIGHVGALWMAGQFSMVRAPGSSLQEASVTFVAKEAGGDAWRGYEGSLAADDALQIAGQVEAVGLPMRAPVVETVYDTSSSWTQLAIRVRRNDQVQAFDLSLQCSGFEGDDAHALRQLLVMLGSAAGYEMDRSIVFEPMAPPPPSSAPSNAWQSPTHCSHCGHKAGAECYQEDRRSTCPNGACGKQLLPWTSTCMAGSCGHLVPIATRYCWTCGAEQMPAS